MELKNSYIFLKREKLEENTKKQSKNNTIRITFPHTFKKNLEESFQDIQFDDTNDDVSFISSGSFKIEYNEEKIIIPFKYHKVCSNYYLDVIVETKKKQDAINLLEKINFILIGEKNKFDKNYISIVSYDYISEYYCNKLFPLLNEFERKLRKLLFCIYTLNFNLKYYIATTNEDFKNSLEIKSKRNKPENISKEDYYLKMGFYSLDYNDINTLLFTKSITTDELKQVESFLSDNKDLSKLKDKEIRKHFALCNYKSDWDRFFGNKKIDENFQDTFNNIRLFRNNIAHCKFISREQYKNCLKMLNETIKSLDLAIEITEEEDFITKNIEMHNKSFEKLTENLHEIISAFQKSLFGNMENITGISNILKEIVQPIKVSIPKIILPEIELPKFNIPTYFMDNINYDNINDESKK